MQYDNLIIIIAESARIPNKFGTNSLQTFFNEDSLNRNDYSIEFAWNINALMTRMV